jgi:hypothetical protein
MDNTQQLIEEMSKLGLQALPYAKVAAMAYAVWVGVILLVSITVFVIVLVTFIKNWRNF